MGQPRVMVVPGFPRCRPGPSAPGRSRTGPSPQRRVNTACTVIVLFIEAMPIWFQVRPKSARLIWTSASSHTSPESEVEALASKDNGLVRSRTVRVPDTVTPWPDGWIRSPRR
jgi:hypothetical protein